LQLNAAKLEFLQPEFSCIHRVEVSQVIFILFSNRAQKLVNNSNTLTPEFLQEIYKMSYFYG
jgi:hypothetical protein